MSIQNWSENVIIVDLPKEPQIAEEIQTVIDQFKDRADCNVVVDFSEVDIITSSSISALLSLNKLLTDSECQLILCNVSKATKNIFRVIGLLELFNFVDDKFIALASLQMALI